MSTSSGMDRRDFMRFASTTAAAAGLGMALAQNAEASIKCPVERTDPRAPSTGRLMKEGETIGIGVIGVGGMGGGHVEELVRMEKGGAKIEVRAVSDVYAKRLNYRQKWVKSNTGRECGAYMDYKELLAREDIHAVVIATPDHWHALNAIDAMKAGKDVYLQKPVTLTTEESLEVRDWVYRTGRVFQCGAQGSSDDFWWQARELIKRGGIGKILWAQADYSRNTAGGPEDRGGEWNWPIDADATDQPGTGDKYIDWERWIGPAPKRPFSKPRFFQFRKFWDYSGGIATDLLYHVLAPMTIALDASAPERATAAGGIYVQHDDREVPDTFMVQLDYPEDFTIVLTSSMANRQANPTIIRGHKATIRRDKEKDAMVVTPEDEFKDWFQKEYGVAELVSPNRPRLGHMEKWIDCIHTRGETHLPAETAYRAMAGIKMGVEAYRQDKVIYWDNKRERYVNSHPRPNRKSKVPTEKA